MKKQSILFELLKEIYSYNLLIGRIFTGTGGMARADTSNN